MYRPSLRPTAASTANVTAPICYLVGIVAQASFVAADFYTGPVARAIGGVDLSWVAGIAVVSPVYYFAVRFLQRPLTAQQAGDVF
jgi:nucleobase:cation symporter-1, NCS1 family